jgi:hypothetical protein
MLREYIYRHANIKVCDFRKITNGIECEVYDIGQHMAKLRRRGEVPFECIKWVADLCKEHDIKVPDIIHCGRISDGVSAFDIIIEEKIQVDPIVPDLYEEAGFVLRKIHNIKVDGFWKMYEVGKFYMDINGNKDDDDDSYNTSLCDVIKYFREENIYDLADINYIERLLYEHRNLKISPVLCHGDYDPRHILGKGRIKRIFSA